MLPESDMIRQAEFAARVAHTAQRVHNGCMTDDLMTIPDDGDWPARPAPVDVPGHVDLTGKLPDGSAWRVAVVNDEIRLTVAGPDGLATLALDRLNSNLLGLALNTAETDLIHIARGH